MDALYTLTNEHNKILLRSEIVIKRFKHFSPSNTTEYHGYRKLFWTCCQLINKVELYSQDIMNNNFDKTIDYDKKKYNKVEEVLDANLQSYLVEPENRNIVYIYNYLAFSQLERSYRIP